MFDNILMTRESKYYEAGGVRACPESCRRVAVGHNTSTAVSYLLSDHLGSTSVTANTSGANVTELRYYAYGGVRYNPGNQVTTDPSFHSGHTGQRWDSGTSLYYGARWYDPAIGRFTQADTIVPEPGNPQSLNRHA
ncbi:MAG: hypothetical protein K1X65_15605 [Caldilineales bacterium]|nr:hypothetical protein [Caldilineales bacterium]MCW5857573.1 hypothetical protein [Caldilineales bacterium]